MVTAIILAGGVGSRMKTSGLPKQFLSLYGKPIICYTLETFEKVEEIDQIIVPCHDSWVEKMKDLIKDYQFKKVKKVVVGGVDRQGSIMNALNSLTEIKDDDIVVIHDGVRPLVKPETIRENVTTARKSGNAMTVHQNIETVVVTESDTVGMDNFKNRNNTYTLTSPQTFRVNELKDAFRKAESITDSPVPLLDPALIYAYLGKEVHLVNETGLNLKITTPEDFYYLRSYLELQESKNVLGI